MSQNKTIAKNSLILLLKLLINAIIGLLSTRLIIKGLGVSDFGLYSVVGGVVILMTFINSGMHVASFRFIAFEMGKGIESKVNKVFNISIIIHFGLAFLVWLFTETFGVYYVNNVLNVEPGKINDALFVLRFSSYAAIFGIIGIPFNALITAKEQFKIQAIIEIIRSLLFLTAAVLLISYAGNKLRFYSVLMTVANIIPPVLFTLYCRIRYPEILKWKFQKDVSKYREMVGFAGWTMIGAAASIGKAQGSALIINKFFGTVLNAAFGIANQVNGVISIFSRNLGQAAVPQITKSFSADNKNRSVVLSSYISKYSMFLMLVVALPVLLETRYLLTLWLGILPPFTILFCQLIVINALIDGLGSGLESLVQATGKIKYFQIVLSVTSLMSLPIAYYLFMEGFDPSYITIAFISTAILNVFLRQLLLKTVINFDVKEFLVVSYLKIFFVSVLVSPLFFLNMMISEGTLRFILMTVVAELWLFVSIYFAGLNNKEKTIVRSYTKQFVGSFKIPNSPTYHV